MDEKAKLIYICAPLKGDIKNNIKRATNYARHVVAIGHVPVVPHNNFNGLFDDDNPHERETALLMCRHLLLKCDELWLFTNRVSIGMQFEIEEAKENDIPVKRVEVLDA